MVSNINDYPLVFRYLARLLLVFAIIAALIITKTLLVPLLFAVLVAYLLYPAASKMEDAGIPRILTNLLLIIGATAILAGVAYLIIILCVNVTDSTSIQDNIQENLQKFRHLASHSFGISSAQIDSMVDSMKGSGTYIKNMFKVTANTILALGLIPVYTFLLLFYRNKFRKFVFLMVPSQRKKTTQNIINDVADIVPRYLKGLFLVCFILVILNTLGFYLSGVDYALLLGLIAAICNLIPNLGTVIGYGIVALFVLATQDPSAALSVVIQFFIIQFIENNILTPNITGSYTQINPLVIILSILSGGMIWGLPGMFMVIPYLAIMKIMCEHINDLKPIAYLLSTRGAERHQISLQALKEKLKW